MIDVFFAWESDEGGNILYYIFSKIDIEISLIIKPTLDGIGEYLWHNFRIVLVENIIYFWIDQNGPKYFATLRHDIYADLVLHSRGLYNSRPEMS